MTPLEFSDRLYERRAGFDWLGMLRTAWRALRSRREERKTVVALSRLDRRLIRDAGFDPDLVYGALDGTWHEVAPGRFRHRLPRRDCL